MAVNKYKHNKEYYRYGKTELELIEAINCGLIFSLQYVFSDLPNTLKPFFKNRGQKKFEKTIKRLKEKDIIYLSGDKIKLTKKGKELQKRIEVKEITIQKPKQWDQLWRLVSYDIPDKIKKQRSNFQQALRRLNFRKIHESLWVYPFDCKEEIAVIAEYLKVTHYVIFMTTDYLPNQNKMEKYFRLG